MTNTGWFILTCALGWGIIMTSRSKQAQLSVEALAKREVELERRLDDLNKDYSEMKKIAEEAHNNSIESRKLFLASVQGLNAVGFDLYQREDGNIVITRVEDGSFRKIAPMDIH
jgi:hypothetical protein